MDVLFSVVDYLAYGFVGLLLLLLAVLFGKRVRKRWAFEAEFRDMGERKFGEFEIELSRIARQESGYPFKASLRMRHESLDKGLVVDVYLDDTLVMRGNVKKAGRIFLRDKAVTSAVIDPGEGQVCRIVWDGIEQFRAPVRPD